MDMQWRNVHYGLNLEEWFGEIPLWCIALGVGEFIE
jgi:hypothetical protein